jgi:hypothetical protein
MLWGISSEWNRPSEEVLPENMRVEESAQTFASIVWAFLSERHLINDFIDFKRIWYGKNGN